MRSVHDIRTEYETYVSHACTEETISAKRYSDCCTLGGDALPVVCKLHLSKENGDLWGTVHSCKRKAVAKTWMDDVKILLDEIDRLVDGGPRHK